MRINSKVNKKLASFNDESKIKLRLKRLKNKYSVYIDYHTDAGRERKYLSMYLTGNVDEWQEDRLVLLKAREVQRLFEEKLKLERDKFKLNSSKMDANFVDYFELLADKRKGNTRQNLRSVLSHLKKYTNGYVKFSDINQAFCEGLKYHMLDKCSINTTKHYFSKLSQALEDAIFVHELPMLNYFKRVKHSRSTPPPIRYLTKEELQLLIDNPYPNEKIVNPFLFAAFTGLRLSDVKALIFENVRDGRINIIQIKTKIPLDVQMNNNAEKIINEQMKIMGRKSGKVFDMLDDDYMNRRIKQWVRNCAINKEITFHCGRHTFATMGITAGMSIYEVSALLGHTEIKHTLIYAKLVNKKKDLAAMKYPEML
ncbi:MAG: site-specific integrase [Candidatus Delongbacteria bacterium]|nr:site-specific integrase [Candidatus Delongbacteria bacterium]